MVKLIILYVLFTFSFLLGSSQSIEEIEYIAPFQEGVAAVKKGNQWAFIDVEGRLVIDFRNDLVVKQKQDENYPSFSDNRCLISEKRQGITYFGYIDKTGKTAIKTKFLNATSFKNNVAIAIELSKDTIGNNNLFKKPVVNYNYFEVLINTKGDILYYLTHKPRRLAFSKDFIKQPPEITTRILADNLMAVWSKENKWEIKKIHQ